jgi:hypothetical protein
MSAEFRRLLRDAGYVVSRPKRTSRRQVGRQAIHAVVAAEFTLAELESLFSARAGMFSLVSAQSAEQSAEIDRGRARSTRRPAALAMTLRGLRERIGRTQGEVARRVSMTQPQLSRLEARRDHLISTLHRYVGALGGKIEVAAVVDGARIVLQNV